MKRSLNKLTSCRPISIQEAVHEIAGLDLVVCSDYLTDVSISKGLFLKSKSEQKKKNSTDLVCNYNNRDPKHEKYSLYEYFYEVFCKKMRYMDEITTREKHRVLIPKGMNCRARYPADYDYARGVLVMHKPWSIRNPLKPLLEDKTKTIATFLRMLDKQELPYIVRAEYHRAMKYAQQWRYECVAKQVTPVEDVNLEELDNEELHNYQNWEHSNHLSAQNTRHLDDKCGEMRVNLGLDHDWSQQQFSGTRSSDRMEPELYTKYLKDHFYNKGPKLTNDDEESLHIPKKKDGSDYKIDDLNDDQKNIVICALEAVVKFLENDPTYKPLRATVRGCGGTGKSFIINTLIAMIRMYTKLNDSVQVTAPSGGAAYNVGGCTIHRGLNLSVDPDKLATDLSPDSQKELANKLRNLLALIIDERSMISSALLAGAERNVRHCSLGQQNRNELWGGVPVVLIFGDDYQLMPVGAEGAISGYSRRCNLYEASEERKSPKIQAQIAAGNSLFIDNLTEDVFDLTVNYRSRNDPEYAKILERLREGVTTDEDAKRLMKLFWEHQTDEVFRDSVENSPKTIHLFANNYEKNQKNRDKLVNLSNSSGCPVARLQCKWQSNNQGGASRVYKKHFEKLNVVLETDLCVGATVSLSNNIVPEAGLYNGARGTVVDFVYEHSRPEGPNDKDGEHLPLCVIVDFPGLRLEDAKPWDECNPTVSVDILQEGKFDHSQSFILIPYTIATTFIEARSYSDGEAGLCEKMLQCEILPLGIGVGNHNP